MYTEACILDILTHRFRSERKFNISTRSLIRLLGQQITIHIYIKIIEMIIIAVSYKSLFRKEKFNDF